MTVQKQEAKNFIIWRQGADWGSFSTQLAFHKHLRLLCLKVQPTSLAAHCSTLALPWASPPPPPATRIVACSAQEAAQPLKPLLPPYYLTRQRASGAKIHTFPLENIWLSASPKEPMHSISGVLANRKSQTVLQSWSLPMNPCWFPRRANLQRNSSTPDAISINK